MNILIIYPEKESNKKSLFQRLLSGFQSSHQEPLELLELSIQLPITWDRRLVDLNTDKLRQKDVDWADFVVIKASCNQESSALTLLKDFKNMAINTIGEGELFSTDPSRFEEVDHLILNGASMHALVSDLESNKAKHIYFPLMLKRHRNPYPDYSLLGVSSYFSRNIQTFSA